MGGTGGERQKEVQKGLEEDNEEQKRRLSYFDFKSSFESTCEEPSKGANERSKSGEGNAVDLEGVHPDCFLRTATESVKILASPVLLLVNIKSSL